MRATISLLKSSSSNRWLARQARDPFVRARAEGQNSAVPTLRARSGFKLAELAGKYRNLLHGRAVVDLGAAPGGWTQIAAAAVARRGGAVVAVDMLPMEDIKHAFVVEGDFFDARVQDQVRAHLTGMQRGRKHGGGGPAAPTPTEEDGEPAKNSADTVLSDMMAPMSGVRDRDVQASLDLVAAATHFAHQVLRPADPGAEAAEKAAKKDKERKNKEKKAEKKAGKKATATSPEPPAEAEAEAVAEAADPKLYPGGSLVMKFFLHPDLLAFRKDELDPYFARVVTEKPKASRSESSEAYWVCLGYRGRPTEEEQ